MTQDFALWVPESVRLMAGASEFNPAAKHRLLTDQRMKDVWSDLTKSPVDAKAYDELQGFQRLDGWGLDDLRFTLSEKAAASMLNVALLEFQSDHLLNKSELDKNIKEWERVSSWCRGAWSIDYAPLTNEDLAEALRKTAEHFDGLVSKFRAISGPRIIERSSRDKNGTAETRRDKDLARVRATAVISMSDKLYLMKHRKPMSILCTVGLDRPVSVSDIDDYRTALSS